MDFPLISRERVFLDLVKVRWIDSSERKESAVPFPLSHSEACFKSRHLLKLCDFSF